MSSVDDRPNRLQLGCIIGGVGCGSVVLVFVLFLAVWWSLAPPPRTVRARPMLDAGPKTAVSCP